MIKVLEEAIAKVRDLPAERQKAAAEALEVIAAQLGNDALTTAEIEGVKRAQKEVRRGKYAKDRKVGSFFARFRA